MKYEIEETNSQSCLAPEFIGRKFKTMEDALEAFDSIYYRQRLRIMIYRHDSVNEKILVRIVKSSFR